MTEKSKHDDSTAKSKGKGPRRGVVRANMAVLGIAEGAEAPVDLTDTVQAHIDAGFLTLITELDVEVSG